MELPHRSPLYVTRRELLKLSGMLAASSLLSAYGAPTVQPTIVCPTPTPAPPLPSPWVSKKRRSSFYPLDLAKRFENNLASSTTAYQQWLHNSVKRTTIDDAELWCKFEYGELRDLVSALGDWSSPNGTIRPPERAQKVSDKDDCPACGKHTNWVIEMYRYPWIRLGVDPWVDPAPWQSRQWKVQCSNCGGCFPTNDFWKYYSERCFTLEKGEPTKERFEDWGYGYTDGDRIWRFIGYFLVHGQWTQFVLSGIKKLSAAYLLTRASKDPYERKRALEYSYRAAVLLDRVADLYPYFDFRQQGYIRRTKEEHGYVSYWGDSCGQTRELVLAYDRIYDSFENFIEKKKEINTFNKSSFYQVKKNIECGILYDALKQAKVTKIHSNFPGEDVTRLITEMILDPDRGEIVENLHQIILSATEVDGTTGEKGLGSYSTSGIDRISEILALINQTFPEVWKNLFIHDNTEKGIAKRLHDMFLFHVETRCLGKYYPNIGDANGFGEKEFNDGVMFTGTPIIPGPGGACKVLSYPYWLTHPAVIPSMFTLFWKLLGEMDNIGDRNSLLEMLLRRKYDAGCALLPYDPFVDSQTKFQDELAKAVASLDGGLQSELCPATPTSQVGPSPDKMRFGSLKKDKWRLAILRSQSKDAALWLHFASGSSHGHYEGINLGLFAKGLDLLPDFGYPPVDQYGGWNSPQSQWYQMAPAHNTVVVDGDYYPEGNADCTCWLGDEDADGVRDGQQTAFRAIRVSGPSMIKATTDGTGLQFERTVALVDIPDTEDSYGVDIFRVVGGHDHAYFFHTSFGELLKKEYLEESNQNPQGDQSLFLYRPMGTEYEEKLKADFWCQYVTKTKPSDAVTIEPRFPLKDFEGCTAPPGPWVVEWSIAVPNDPLVYLRYIGPPCGAELYLGKMWVEGNQWLPGLVMHRRLAGAQRSSTFVGIIEAHGGKSRITNVRRLRLKTQDGEDYPDSFVAIEITILGGDGNQYRDLIVAADVEDPLALAPANRSKEGMQVEDKFWMGKSKYDAELHWIRTDEAGNKLASRQYPPPMTSPLLTTSSPSPCPTATPCPDCPTPTPATFPPISTTPACKLQLVP